MTADKGSPAERLRQYYEGDYYDDIGFSEMMGDEQQYNVRAAFSAYKRRNIAPGAKVFEFGCGPGYNLVKLPNAIKEAYDISAAARRFVREKGIVVYDSPDDIPREHYDVVICSQVLEHVPSPLDTLKLLHSLLVDGGQLDLMLPEEFFRRIPKVMKEDLNRHLYAWAPCNIVNLLILCDFTVEQMYYLPRFASMYTWKRLGRWPRFAMFVLKVLGRLTPHALRDFRVLARTAGPKR